ncbi:MAG: SDR family oxidoreductase [Chloroflexota bacterium]|jgi:NAD(P)-dependent dehydrogenase (short-subunit alcohol dehydrogenase family)
MKIIVITGSTRGIGYGLADAFLDLGQAVVISGRSQAGVDEAVEALSGKHQGAAILGWPCDVTQAEQVQALWDATREHFQQVDIWINNAGVSQSLADVRQLPPQQMATIVETNILGTLYGSRVALNGMIEQGFGALYNMEGLGSNGRKQAHVTVYGTTKYAIRYLNEVLEMETKDTPVLVGALLPGMVVTDILTAPYADRPEQWEKDKRIFNILADRVETVTPWMAKEILTNEKHGARINWNRRGRMLTRFLTAPFRRRRVVD